MAAIKRESCRSLAEIARTAGRREAPVSTGTIHNLVTGRGPEVWHAIQGERARQQFGLEMIASENYTSPAVMAAQGTIPTVSSVEPSSRTSRVQFVHVCARRLSICAAMYRAP
jgi:hypothetical protein